MGERLLVLFAEVAAATDQVGQRLGLQGLRVEPGQVEPHLQVAEFVDREGAGAGFPALGSLRLPLARQLQVARMGARPGMVGAFAHTLHDEGPFGRVEVGGRLQGVLPVHVDEVTGGVDLQLLHERGDQVEGLVEVGVGG